MRCALILAALAGVALGSYAPFVVRAAQLDGAPPQPHVQTGVGLQEPKPKPEVRAALDAAYSSPPEFAADALITLAEGRLIPGPRQRLRILEDAFALAARAPEKMQLELYGKGALTTSGNAIYRKGFDVVSLQARSAAGLAELDLRRARQRFEQIQLSFETIPSCEDPFIWSPAVYYDSMWKIASLLPPVEQQAFIQARLGGFRSSGQVRPLSLILEKVLDAQGDAAAPLVAEFFSHLPKLRLNSREFTSSFESASVPLARIATQAPKPARESIIRAIREWVVRESNNGVCLQNATYVMSIEGSIRQVAPMHPAERYNKDIAVIDQPPATIDLSKEVKAQVNPIPSTAESYSDAYLRFDSARLLLAREADEDKLTPRWKAEMAKYIAAAVAWSDPSCDHSEPIECYLEKAEVLQRILTIRAESMRTRMTAADVLKLVAEGHEDKLVGRERVILALVEWFAGPTALKVYDIRRIRWFQAVSYALASRNGRDALLDDLLAASRHPVLHLYGLLAQLKGKSEITR